MSEIHYSCKSCGWSYSLSRNDFCPMCKEEPKIDLKFLIELLVDYCNRKAFNLRAKDAKMIISRYKKENKAFPTLNELWELAEQTIQKSIDRKFIDKKGKQEKAEPEKMRQAAKEKRERGLAKEERLQKIEAKRKGIEEEGEKPKVVKKIEKGDLEEKEEDIEFVRCLYCGFKNSIESAFCGKCGKKV